MPDLSILSPDRLEDALLALQGGTMDILAGGTDFFPAGRAGPGRKAILDLSQIAALRGIVRDGAGWRIGAMTRWSDVWRMDLPPAFAGLQAAAREVGSIQIQNSGTVAGNICNASPAADGMPPLLTLEAEVEIAAHGTRRRVPLQEFVTGVRKIDLRPGEMVTALHLPELPEGAVGRFEKLGSRRYLVISISMVSALIGVTEGRISTARVAVGAASPVAQRLPALEAGLTGVTAADLAAFAFDDPAFYQPLSPIDDVRGSGAYRREAVAELCRRAILSACEGCDDD